MMHPDWSPADIIAGLRKKGTSLAEVSRRPGWCLPRWQMR
ncbi:winged helix-turn-helix DNA-binding family protein [Escherichia coli 1-110-08_S4_C3]|nr:winged helix-turn-helix DNA-binding family protein [Escherichia coli 1-110-08_S4_C3]EYD99826.1 winged helix-turn-helix DNA-binding family protein [Escherichia coli 1-110-08_S4_C2]